MPSQEIVDYERKMTKRVLWKLDCHVLPPLALLWLANFIDRSNVGNARIAGLETDTHLHGNQFNTVLAGAYMLVEMPSNWILKKLGANRWLPIIVCAWGIVTTLTGLVHNLGGILAIRIVLGACEGGLLPGMILYLSTIYKRHELQLRCVHTFQVMYHSSMFHSLLATAILKMDGIGGLAGWRWIFILEGICTILFCLVAAIYLPADIASARFLTTEEREFAAQGTDGEKNSVDINEKEKPSEFHRENASEDLISSRVTQEEEQFEWKEVMRGVLDVQTWLTGFAYFGLIVSLYSYSLFLPTIVAGLGYTGSAAQLHTVPPYVPAVVLTVFIAFLSDRFRWRGPFILICLPIAIVGYIVAITAETDTGRYAAVFLMATGVYPSGPSILSILPNNSNGHYKRATTTALQLAIANCGGFVATFAYTPDQAPKYIRGHTIVLCFLILAWILIAANVCYCLSENKARADGRRQHNLIQYQELWNSGRTSAPIGDRHPDFRFTL
ncbi:MFS transporter [Lentinula novae-zelandiae]|nr:MFS transporter [Lentinula novae-zelandiae]